MEIILRFSNIIESPSSSKNGYFKNTITLKNLKNLKMILFLFKQ